MKKEKNITYKIIIIILILLLICIVGYIIIDKTKITSQKDQNNPQEQLKEPEVKEEQITRNITEQEKNTLMDQIETYNKNFASYYPLMNINSISNHDLFTFARNKLNIQDIHTEFYASSIDEIIKKYFGDNINIKHENYICDIDDEIFYLYNEDTKKYTFNESVLHGHGGNNTISDTKALYINGSVKNDTYTVQAKVLYGRICGDICGPNNAYYISYEEIGKTPVVEDKTVDELPLTDELILQNENEIPLTTYTFQKDQDGNYGLISVTR